MTPELETGIYARQSEDNPFNLSLPNQAARCKDYAERLARQLGVRFTIAPHHIWIDEGESGVSFDRPAYAKVWRAIERHEIGALIVYAVDRLGRTPKVLDMLRERQRFIDHGVRVWTVTEDFEVTADDESVDIRFFFDSLQAGREHKKIAQRTSQGKEKARQIRPEAISYGGQPPYGYMSVKGIITPNPDHRLALVQIFELGARGVTAEDTALTLNRQGVPAPRGRQWHPRTIQRIWANPIYRGDGMLVNYTDPDTHEAMHTVYPAPALIDPETFAAVARQAAVRKRTHHVERSLFWLSGKAICGLCGQHFNGFSNTKEHTRYYRCDGRGQYKRWDYPTPCPMPIVAAHLLEGPIWDDMRQVLSDPTLLTAALADQPDEAQIEKEFKRIDGEIAAHKSQIGRLRDGWAAQVFTPDEIAAGVAGHRAEIDRLETERASWEYQRFILQRQGPAEVNLDNLPAEAKAALAEQMIDRIDMQHVGPKAIRATVFYFLLPDSAGGQGRHNLSTGAMLPLTVARPLEIVC